MEIIVKFQRSGDSAWIRTITDVNGVRYILDSQYNHFPAENLLSAMLHVFATIASPNLLTKIAVPQEIRFWWEVTNEKISGFTLSIEDTFAMHFPGEFTSEMWISALQGFFIILQRKNIKRSEQGVVVYTMNGVVEVPLSPKQETVLE